MKTVLVMALVVVTMTLAGCASDKPAASTGEPAMAGAPSCAPAQPATGAPQDLVVVDALAPVKDAFNAHADRPRVLLLVSPTCSECVLGARAVRESIVNRFAESGVVAIVVWEPMLETDSEDAARSAAGIFADARAVRQFYDPARHAGWAYERERFARKWDEVEAALPPDHWLRQAHDRKPDPAPEWDVYMLFKPGVRWGQEAPKPDAFIRHIGRDEHGRSHYFRDRFDAPPASGDLFEAMEQMARDVLDARRELSIELLGFPDCPNAGEMRENVKAAITLVGGGLALEEVNQEALDKSDPRRGWPAPTVLVDGSELFGMPAPRTPAMTCRVYEGGVPDATAIAARLRALQSQPHGEVAR